MELPHVVLISRSYWPQTSGQSLHLRLVAESLADLGVSVTVVSPLCHPSWPSPLLVGNVRLLRLKPAPASDRSISKYSESVTDWISSQKKIDLVIADQDATEIEHALRKLPSRARPAIWQLVQRPSDNDALVKTLRRVDRVVVPNSAASRFVASQGVVSQRIARIQLQVPERKSRNERERLIARRLLEQVNTDLHARKYDRVILCHCPMDEYKQWHQVIKSLRDIVDSHRWLRWWIIGHGPIADTIYERLQDEGLHRLVAMPGVFTDVELLFDAADLYLSVEEDCDSWFFQNAAMNATPWLNHQGQWADLSTQPTRLKQSRQDSLSETVLSWLDNAESSQALAFKNQRAAKRQSEYPTLASLVETFLSEQPSTHVSKTKNLGDL